MVRGRFASVTGADSADLTSLVGVGLLIGGFALVLNPLYLDALLPYPMAGDGFDLTPLYFSELTVIGALLLAAGGFSLVGDVPLTARRATGVAIVAMALYVIFSRIGLGLLPHGPRIRPLDAWEIWFVIVMLFPLGIVIKQRDRRGARTVLLSALIGFSALLVSRFLFLMLQGRDVYGAVANVGQTLLFVTVFLVYGRDLLEIPFIGGILALVPLVLGYLYPLVFAEAY